MQIISILVNKKNKLAIPQTIAIKLKENVTMILTEWKSQSSKKTFFLKIGILFQNSEKNHLNSFGNGAEFGPPRIQKNPKSLKQYAPQLFQNWGHKEVFSWLGSNLLLWSKMQLIN